MFLSIRHKLFLALAIVSMFATVLMASVFEVNLRSDFSEFRTQQDLQRLRNVLPGLENHYRSLGSWNVIATNSRVFAELLRQRPSRPPQTSRLNPFSQGAGIVPSPTAPEGFRRPPPPKPGEKNARKPPPPRPPVGSGLLQRASLLDNEQKILTPFTQQVDYKLPIEVDGEIVGWLGLARAASFSDQLDQQFLSSQRKSLYIVAGAAIFFALITALLLAKHFITPVQTLAKGMDLLTQGDFKQHLDIKRKDELGQLGHDFNQLALSLEKNEQLRRQWVADTSHELRTPIAILRGEIEAIRDGIRSNDEKIMASLHEEILHLSKLVDDLNTLSLSDAGALNYHMEDLDIGELIEQITEEFETRAAQQGIRINYHAPINMYVRADATRIQQLLCNLIENSLRYTDAPGQLNIQCNSGADSIALVLEDTSPAPSGEAVSQLFERFFRTDSSRNRKVAGSGLGLAICRNIVEAHQGHIKAYRAETGGLGVYITLPKAI